MRQENRTSRQAAVVIAGHICSGKSTLVTALQTAYGWSSVSFGKLVKAEAVARGFPIERRTLQDLGQEMLERLGAKGLLQAAVDCAAPRGGVHLIDGVRHPSVWTATQQAYENAVLFVIKADPQDRYARCRQTYGNADGLNYSNFVAVSRHPIEIGIDALEPLANQVLNGSQPTSEVFHDAEQLLKTLGVLNP